MPLLLIVSALAGCGGPSVGPGTYLTAPQSPPPDFQLALYVSADGGTIVSAEAIYKGCAEKPGNEGFVFQNIAIDSDGTFDSGVALNGEELKGTFDGSGHVSGSITDLLGINYKGLAFTCRVRDAAYQGAAAGT